MRRLHETLPINQDNEAVFYFPVLWAIFEKEVFGKNFDTEHVQAWAEDVYGEEPSPDWVGNVFSWFQTRYETEGGTLTSEWIYALGLYKKKIHVEYRDALRLNEDHLNDEGVRVSEILANPTPSIPAKIEGMAYIVHRVRNNFFHGEKDLYSMSGQIPLLEKCNAFLSRCIDDLTLRRCTLAEVHNRPVNRLPKDLSDQTVYPRVAKRNRT